MTQPATTTTKKTNPFTVPAGKRALLLVPYEPTQRDQVAELLANAMLDGESIPRVVQQIKLLKLTDLDVIFTAVPVSKKLGPRKQPINFELKIGKPVFADKFTSDHEDSDGVDYRGVVEALQPNAFPFSCKISNDKILKLLEC